ncbi:MAG: class III poly(R)-hydroxyalkanoic acid synthase subunit PhaE [Gammaproteobacteria bacterium]|nr:class III poly(R)-hydroxyalkanoic acid synthase subunit PhaE [Gammaproteobacteria bacterium]
MNKKGFWDDDWLDAQRKYWEIWGEMSQKAAGASPTQVKLWQHALDHWWQAISPAAPDLTRDFMERMIGQGKQLFDFAEKFKNDGGASGAVPGWEQALEGLRSNIQSSLADGDKLSGVMGFWETPLSGWQAAVNSLSKMPGGLPEGMASAVPGFDLERALTAPGLGYTREQQASHQELIRLTKEYQQAQQAYTDFFSGLGEECVKRLGERLSSSKEKEETIDSGRLLYDTWVAICEEVYGEHVRTPEFARLQGRLVNALMRVKRQFGAMVDDHLGSLGMPTREEMRTLQVRIQDNRREIKALRMEMEVLKEGLPKARPPGAKTSPGSAANRNKGGGPRSGTRKKTVARKKATVKRKTTVKKK